jgi:hypothetical protein
MSPLRVIAAVWVFMGSVRLSVVLCFLLALDLAVAFPVIRWNLVTFVPLGQIDVWTWLSTYGRYNLGHTFWFFLMLLLLTLLGLNTFVCSTQRVCGLFRQGRGPLALFLRLGPHIMHYAVLVTLLGYLGSYLLSDTLPGRALNPKGPPLKIRQIGGEFTCRVESPRFYHGGRLPFFDGWALDPGLLLTFTDSAGKTVTKKIAYSEPAVFNGWTVHLTDFYPKREGGGGMGLNFIEISFRRDYSSYVYLAGIALFLFGLVLYTLDFFRKKRAGKKENFPEPSPPPEPQAPDDSPQPFRPDSGEPPRGALLH